MHVFNKKACNSCVLITFLKLPRSFDDVYSPRAAPLLYLHFCLILPTFTFYYFIRGMSRQSLGSSFQDLANVLLVIQRVLKNISTANREVYLLYTSSKMRQRPR